MRSPRSASRTRPATCWSPTWRTRASRSSFAKDCQVRSFFLYRRRRTHETFPMNGIERDVAARMAQLFRRWPGLGGFAVRDGYVSDIACYPEQTVAEAAELREDIAAELVELLDERPEAADVVRG